MRHFGVDLDDAGVGVSLWTVAACAARMPLGSQSLASAGYPKAAWTNSEHLLYAIARALVGDCVSAPWEQRRGDELPSHVSSSVSDFDEWYRQKWRDDGWQEVL